ncbi:hypothetical protein [Austwickia chelonae]|uniref:Uncharacterized protein n=1 Tax=Austwickia chelonae NBRC 105200 TaxID=1184607 RepID=K6UNQ4_9MICO|nr:hypothetical protein [Austwickia chelonae]GAB79166.1 hypothetical protein AUCHE_20_00380 [Austwickia chelonae NBRC 105200]
MQLSSGDIVPPPRVGATDTGAPGTHPGLDGPPGILWRVESDGDIAGELALMLHVHAARTPEVMCAVQRLSPLAKRRVDLCRMTEAQNGDLRNAVRVARENGGSLYLAATLMAGSRLTEEDLLSLPDWEISIAHTAISRDWVRADNGYLEVTDYRQPFTAPQEVVTESGTDGSESRLRSVEEPPAEASPPEAAADEVPAAERNSPAEAVAAVPAEDAPAQNEEDVPEPVYTGVSFRGSDGSMYAEYTYGEHAAGSPSSYVVDLRAVGETAALKQGEVITPIPPPAVATDNPWAEQQGHMSQHLQEQARRFGVMRAETVQRSRTGRRERDHRGEARAAEKSAASGAGHKANTWWDDLLGR